MDDELGDVVEHDEAMHAPKFEPARFRSDLVSHPLMTPFAKTPVLLSGRNSEIVLNGNVFIARRLVYLQNGIEEPFMLSI